MLTSLAISCIENNNSYVLNTYNDNAENGQQKDPSPDANMMLGMTWKRLNLYN
jgi:hypothetical protein